MHSKNRFSPLILFAAVLNMHLVESAGASPIPARISAQALQAITQKNHGEVIKLWLLNHAWETQAQQQNPDRDTLLSALWLAIGRTGHCPEGIAPDPRGLWTIATHNAVLLHMHPRDADPSPPPFDAFGAGEQHRFISLRDILSPQELLSLKLRRPSPCLTWLKLTGTRRSPFAPESPGDRRQAALALQSILTKAQATLQGVAGVSIVESRLFDIQLFLTGESKENREDSSSELLRRAARWTAEDWMALSPERRLFLFGEIRRRGLETEENLPLQMIDRLLVEKKGSEISDWIAYFDAKNNFGKRTQIWKGDRGAGLLALDPSAGFRGRATIALHRGIGYLEGGNVEGALRSFSWALRFAPESDGGEAPLARRWLSHVVGTYETDATLLTIIQDLLPREETLPVLEDLAWRAAFRADASSFSRVLAGVRGGGAIRSRLERLTLLAQGRSGAFSSALKQELIEEPYAAVRFLKGFLDRLESEDLPIRQRLAEVLAALERDAEALPTEGRSGRALDELKRRVASVRQGLSTETPLSAAERSRRFAPGTAVFAGSLRVAPPDELPWPFEMKLTRPPNVFVPIDALPSTSATGDWRLQE